MGTGKKKSADGPERRGTVSLTFIKYLVVNVKKKKHDLKKTQIE